MITVTHTVKDVRNWFRELRCTGECVVDKTGCKMIEVVGATFIADEPAIFGSVNYEYARREIDWYTSMSLNVNDIPGSPPTQWVKCADPNGFINSNYGWAVWHKDNCDQYKNVKNELLNNPESRRAVMIYTRPNIWSEFNKNGMSDFICTNDVQYLIRDGKLNAVVQMRSNDLVFGYKNDKFWQDHVHRMLAMELEIPIGPMIWHAGSLHVYERHFSLIT